MFKSKVATATSRIDSDFSSVSNRDARWSLSAVDTKSRRDERISVSMEKSKDGLELNVRRANAVGGTTETEARNYLIELIR